MKKILVITTMLMFAFAVYAQEFKGPMQNCLQVDYNGPKYAKECKNYYIKNCCEGSIKIKIDYFNGIRHQIKNKKLKPLEIYHIAFSISSGGFIKDIYAEELPKKQK